MSNTVVTTINEQLNNETPYQWEWDETILKPEQLEFKRQYLDKHPEIRNLLEEGYLKAPIIIDALSAAFKNPEDIANSIRQSSYSKLAENPQFVHNHTDGNIPLDISRYQLYPYMVAQAIDLAFRSGSSQLAYWENHIQKLKDQGIPFAKNANAQRMLFETLIEQAKQLTKHEQEHLGAFINICRNAVLNGTNIAATANIGIAFNLYCLQEESDQDNQEYDPRIQLSVGGFVQPINLPLINTRDRHLTPDEITEITLAPTFLSSGDKKATRFHQQ